MRHIHHQTRAAVGPVQGEDPERKAGPDTQADARGALKTARVNHLPERLVTRDVGQFGLGCRHVRRLVVLVVRRRCDHHLQISIPQHRDGVAGSILGHHRNILNHVAGHLAGHVNHQTVVAGLLARSNIGDVGGAPVEVGLGHGTPRDTAICSCRGGPRCHQTEPGSSHDRCQTRSKFPHFLCPLQAKLILQQ